MRFIYFFTIIFISLLYGSNTGNTPVDLPIGICDIKVQLDGIPNSLATSLSINGL
jgi:hypothetical protein